MKKILRKFTTAAIALSLSISIALPIVAAELHPANMQWDDIETINDNIDDLPAAPNTTKRAVDLTAKFPTPGNQGGQYSCVAWAVGYSLKSGQEYIKRDWTKNTDTHNFSPSFIYNQLTSSGRGITISSAMSLVVNQGVCSMNYFSYDETDYSTKPSSKVKAAAGLYKSSAWCTIEGITAIKNHIANGDGVVIGIKVYPDFDNISSTNQIYDSTAGTSRGAHAICLIGYDNNKGSNGAFKFINSWGTEWGINGYGWISYDLVESQLVNNYGKPVGYIMYPADDNYILGDINDDGVVNASDSLLILQHSAKSITLSDRECALADVDGNTVINSEDSNYILKYAAKVITKLPLYD